ncbi:MAG: hypothetical protein ACFFKA_13530 [Candidatus Thorarchaeota archaeon]
MEENIKSIKSCIDCGKPLQFKEFCENHPLLKTEYAKELYFNPIINIYCPNCYFERPEKPFKVRRRSFIYYHTKFKS